MPHHIFRGSHAWVFDLDNTLYPPSARLFAQMEVRMTEFVMREIGVGEDEAHELRRRYWREHGTTLNGLMKVHGIAPEPFLEEVHRLDLSGLAPDPGLAAAIDALPGRKIVYTNGSRAHADRVLAARGLSHLFAARYGIEDAGFDPKPQRVAFERVFAKDSLDPAGAAMVEDDIRNLAAPREMGMRTLWVSEIHEPHDADAHTDDLAGFLEVVNER